MQKKPNLNLTEEIKKAIEDLEVTNAEYQKIMAVALADDHIDPLERNLLRQFHELIANGTIKRVP